MNEETGFVAAVLRDLATSTAVILAAWDATNAWPSIERTGRAAGSADRRVHHQSSGGALPFLFRSQLPSLSIQTLSFTPIPR